MGATHARWKIGTSNDDCEEDGYYPQDNACSGARGETTTAARLARAVHSVTWQVLSDPQL
eukprot:CAMPEP_0206140772 /NCGR_PEP_ID=MMETSP1473-20131121/10606_1 /ASSEMBLY_ACC=CAM_ASM_001109 /TAXON_ID=1461547 /ORGANISM="Stichococcus sp, Strain RCC1054" /LENGTH=59 /DNA_ID=CAMNT_0053535055 /DNA_START=769 /DNA_END=948 /DNA_ORIENTATION=-